MSVKESYVAAPPLRLGWRVIWIAATAVVIGLVACWYQFGPRFEATPVEVIISWDVPGWTPLTLRDPAEIETLVMRPLRWSRRDWDPKKWVIYGSMRLIYSNGREDGVMLFSPIGEIKRGDSYFTTDLSALEERSAPSSRVQSK